MGKLNPLGQSVTHVISALLAAACSYRYDCDTVIAELLNRLCGGVAMLWTV